MNEEKNESEKSESDKSDVEDYKKMKEGDNVKKDKNLGKLLKTIVKKRKKIKGDYILSKNKLPLEKLKQEEIENLKRKEKRMLRNIRIRLGYVKFDDWDKSYEKKLLKATRRGVVKFFNSIVDHRKKEMEMQKNEEEQSKKKSNNFLMMHDLKYLNPNDEDDDEENINKSENKSKNKNKNKEIIDISEKSDDDDNEQNENEEEEEKDMENSDEKEDENENEGIDEDEEKQ